MMNLVEVLVHVDVAGPPLLTSKWRAQRQKPENQKDKGRRAREVLAKLNRGQLPAATLRTWPDGTAPLVVPKAKAKTKGLAGRRSSGR